MSRNAMWINDWDPWNVRFALEDPSGMESAPTSVERTTLLPLRVGAIPLAREAETTTREITLAGVIMGTSLADCRNKLDELKVRLFNGAVELRFAPRTDRMVLARCLGVEFIGNPPKFANPKARIQIRMLCPDPLIYTKLGIAIGFTATRAACPLGSAVSFPIIRIAGAVTNPVLSYRDVRGVVKQTMGFTATLGATEYLEIDTERADIQRVTAGVTATGMALWTSGDFLSGMDPQDADTVNGQYPTLEVSPTASCEALYRKAWL